MKTNILITGGTGSFGKAFLKYLLKNYPKVNKIVIFSRDELKQYELNESLSDIEKKKVRFFIGDIRDKERLKLAFEEIDIIVHAAALKQVPAAEYNPIEFIKTNVLGAQNIIEAAIERKVKKVIALSTDKAAAPVNLYGATKLCSDKLFISANNLVGRNPSSFSVVRYGNVMMSRGSVIPKILDCVKNKKIFYLTHKDMTRFNLSLEEGVRFVLKSIKMSKGGEIFIPKIPSYKLTDVVKAFGKNLECKLGQIRYGEKLHEEMITKSDSIYTLDCKSFYIICSSFKHKETLRKKYKAKSLGESFSYNSLNNINYLSVNKIKSLIKKIHK